MKRVARGDEDETILGVPVIVRLGIVAVQPPTVVVVLDLEHVRVVVGVGDVRTSVRNTARRVLSGLNRIRHRNGLGVHTKYLHYFDSSRVTLRRTVIRRILDACETDSAAGNRDLPHIRLLPIAV